MLAPSEGSILVEDPMAFMRLNASLTSTSSSAFSDGSLAYSKIGFMVLM